jgi:hypothetical protein
MGEWRVGRKLGRTLYRDEVFVGLIDSPELAAEIVETMNRVGRLLDEVRGPKPLADSPFEEPAGGTRPACSDPWAWHKHGRCAGDFLCCDCTATPPESGRERSGCIGMGPCDDDLGKSDDEDADDHPVDCGCAVCLQERDELFT